MAPRRLVCSLVCRLSSTRASVKDHFNFMSPLLLLPCMPHVFRHRHHGPRAAIGDDEVASAVAIREGGPELELHPREVAGAGRPFELYTHATARVGHVVGVHACQAGWGLIVYVIAISSFTSVGL